MLEKIRIGHFCCTQSTQVENFRPLVGDALIDELKGLARDLKDVRICHINATPFGGGVAELLSRQIPILDSMGVNVDWRIIHGDQEFFPSPSLFTMPFRVNFFTLPIKQKKFTTGKTNGALNS